MTGPTIAAERSFPFVVARGRSGTTLLRAMLDSHPDMAVPDESHFVVQVARQRARYEPDGRLDLPRFTRDLLGHWAFRRWGLPDEEVLEAFRADPPADVPAAVRAVYLAYAAHHGKTRFADKTPSYVLNVGLLAATFPEARFVHMIRDGRDVALSYLDTDFGSRTLGQAALYWDRFVRAGRLAGSRLGPDRYLEIRYEDLVAEPEPVLKELCAFVGLDFDERMLRFHERADELVPSLSHNEAHRNLYKPLTAGLRDWRRDLAPRDVAVFEALAGELLSELGYERGAPRPGVLARATAAWIRFTTQVRRVAHGSRVRGRKLRRRLGRIARRRAPVPGSGPARIPS
jgi:hypothetical protein